MTSKELIMDLKVIRIKKGISQEKLAKQIGVTRASITNWEKGTTYPSIDIILQVCDVLGVNLKIKEKNNG